MQYMTDWVSIGTRLARKECDSVIAREYIDLDVFLGNNIGGCIVEKDSMLLPNAVYVFRRSSRPGSLPGKEQVADSTKQCILESQ